MSSAELVGLNNWLRKVKGQTIVQSVRWRKVPCFWRSQRFHCLLHKGIKIDTIMGPVKSTHSVASYVLIFFKCDWHFYSWISKEGYCFILLQEHLMRFSFPPHKLNFTPILSWLFFITLIISRGFSPASFCFLSLKTKNSFQYFFFQTRSVGFISLRWRWPKTVLPCRPNNMATGFFAV